MSGIKKVGFVGIGRMGYPMAGHLVAAGFEVAVADANPEVVEKFIAEHSAIAAGSLAELAKSCDVLFTMLPTSEVVRTVVLGDGAGDDCLAEGLKPGAILIDSSTSNPVHTRALGVEMDKRGARMLDAPVAGGQVFAVDGTLDITVGGEEKLVETCRPLFEAFGGNIFHCGALGSGHAMKALNNFVNASALVSAVEALAVGRRFGLDTETMISSMTAAATGRNNPIEKKVIPHILTRRFATGMDLGLLAKDTRITVDMAEAIGAFAPIADRCSALWTEAAETLGASEDQTVVAKLWEQNNDVTLELGD
ncbi:MAG: NAD(P)-dependent oxidoreductase [Rhodospirillaceae bacterium]|nr:NAD(P)-dependent oxidoreductase [Rhodospirillaceae bacterium]